MFIFFKEKDVLHKKGYMKKKSDIHTLVILEQESNYDKYFSLSYFLFNSFN